MKSGKKDIQIYGIIASLLVIASFLYFQFLVPYHLFFKEQLQLFVYTSGYFGSYFSKPGGLACYIGDFLTQFLYLRGGGATVVSLILLVEWLLISKILKTMRVEHFAPLWALFPVVAEWVVYSEISFSIAMSMSFILTLSVFGLYRQIKNNTISILCGIILTPVLYFSVGGGMLLFPVLVLLYDIYAGKKRVLYWILLIVCAGIIPFLMRHFYLLTLKQAYFYPYINLKTGLGLIVLVVVVLFVSIKPVRKLPVTIPSFLITIVLILSFLIGGLVKTTDRNREEILGMATESYFENWNKVLQQVEKSKLPNNLATYYTNIALSKQQQMPDKMMEFYQPFSSGLFLPVNPETGWLTIFFSSDVYFYLGDMNMAQHSAMLGMIFSPYQRSSRLTQHLVEINLVNDDKPATLKYLRMLESTWVHKKQAARLRVILDNPEKSEWLANKRSQLFTTDIIRGANNPAVSLQHLLEANPNNRAALDYLLAFCLLNKDISAFITVYDKYCKGQITYIPKMYEEALLIYLAGTNAEPQQVQAYGISIGRLQEFNEYTALYEQSKGNLQQIEKRFPNTYWMYFHFAQTNK
ncbi:hypothetical protein FACS189437_03600 [Bacteroidia bacterium]|nr:hypothetical protein FACS189437_03600 [Bacteroidia bacterium]